MFHVRADSGGDVHFKKHKKMQLFENFQNDASVKLRWNKLLCSLEIVNQHF